jgi:hypothetical protein
MALQYNVLHHKLMIKSALFAESDDGASSSFSAFDGRKRIT